MTDNTPPSSASTPPSGGERPDLGRTADRLTEALSGSEVGSHTRAGSLAGGAATGSDRDPDQATINESLASEGVQPAVPGHDDADAGARPGAPGRRPAGQGDEVEAPTG
jgi:hypothetical protein